MDEHLLEFPEMTQRRYSSRPFPSYRFIPGLAPHPTRDPEGHSYNQEPDPLKSFDPDKWHSCEEYLFGIDLLNHGYWWEAHEALEAVWAAAGRRTNTGFFVQGLIQVAVAHLKKFQGLHDVAARMAQTGLKKMMPVNQVYLGIDMSRFRSTVTAYFLEGNGKPVQVTLTHSPSLN